MIQAEHLTKRYGSMTAVDDVSFTVRPGRVTGFLGPNGAGKSTTMRMIVGLDRPTRGRVTVNGTPYDGHRAPLHELGALLEARSVHPGRTAYDHLRALGATHGIGARRVREVIALAGLEKVAGKRVGGFSLGMGQRLGIASALLGDPQTVMLDEPVNGLDPEGVMWVRTLTRALAAEGRTVFLSSHLMSEMAKTADHVIVLGRGRVIADAPVQEIIDRASGGLVQVRSPEAGALAQLLRGDDTTVRAPQAGVLEVVGRTSEDIGQIAASAGIVLHQLTSMESSLEDAYLQLTSEAVEYSSGQLGASPQSHTPMAGSPTTLDPAPAPILEGALR